MAMSAVMASGSQRIARRALACVSLTVDHHLKMQDWCYDPMTDRWVHLEVEASLARPL